MHRVGVGEDMNSENDERLIYQAALQVTQSSLMYGLQHLAVLLCLHVLRRFNHLV